MRALKQERLIGQTKGESKGSRIGRQWLDDRSRRPFQTSRGMVARLCRKRLPKWLIRSEWVDGSFILHTLAICGMSFAF